jgi:hypothetical protein
MLAKTASYLRTHGIALLALFVALGGTSYAATQLPTNSVGSKQIKDGEVKKSDLAASIRRSAPLERGETIRGVIDVAGDGAQGGEAAEGITFPIAAPQAVDGDHVDVDSLEEFEDRCEGSVEKPTAPQGVVCVYVKDHAGVEELQGVGAPDHAGSAYGFGLAWKTPQGGPHAVSGTWAYTP